MPNIKLYYWAAHLRTAMFYFSTDHPSWVDIEKEELSLPLQSYIYSAEVKILKKITLNPFLKNTLSVWHEAHSFLEETISISPFSPIWGNNYFIPGRNYMGFKNWQMKGLSMVENLYEGGTLMTFQQLVTKYNLPKKHFFKYLQIRSYIYSRIKAYSKPQHSTLEQITLNHMKDRGMVSLFYKTLLAGLKEGSQSYLSAWKRDLQVDITVEEWEHACLSSQTQSNNTRCRILQYKWMMRTYITPVK